ncbi:class C beta-lactamase-related serine hydrolase [Mucilaginibacter conchicola]|uniref:Class C beta-lactamase-related serine hydrolase n=1 Tax=Mucilaginibacter conchicola TaxID=2303333 RepID=A0A372NSS1_9SPHI|nr:serine hydrolase [Mucilaginibacter conchicola]RFZ92288.1 class C beta-lactamase-related serine hydrolase [Mucilaginibacter conchicola]
MPSFLRSVACFAALQAAFILPLSAQHLPHSLPEAEGVDSKGILNFVNATRTGKTEFHSFMLLRHGKVVAEAWWNPYKPELRHTLYSCSKSFTATAVGFAISEKKLKLSDKVISFFPDQLPAKVSDNLAALSVKDVLMMADGQDPEPIRVGLDSNWVKGFLAAPIVHKPGTVFLYNSVGTYMLSAIVQKVTGQTVLEYLKPRLFAPLGISGMDWETDIKGINTGGWGLRLKTEDMAKFAQLFLQKGKWNGKQILPVGWVEEASSVKIIQHPDMPQTKRDSSDWEQGYCYQMWRCRNNAYRGDGAFGQYMIVMPDQDAVLAVTAETANMQEEINLVWQYLLPAMKSGKLPADKATNAQLQKAIKELALPAFAKSKASFAGNINNKTYSLEPNSLKFSNISFSNTNGTCQVTIKGDTATYKLDFDNGDWHLGKTNKPGPSLTAFTREIRTMLFPAKVAGTYNWEDDHTLQLTLRYIESPHTERFTCVFDNNKVTIRQYNSFEKGKETVLKGMSL